MTWAALIVEGHGEVTAAPILMDTLWSHLGLQGNPQFINWRHPQQKPYRNNCLKSKDMVQTIAGSYRNRGCSCLVLLTDNEDGCPKTDAPKAAGWLRALQLPFPCAVVHAYREYETWFAAHVQHWKETNPVIRIRGQVIGNIVQVPERTSAPERKRDAKEIIIEAMGQTYEETLHQEALTAMIDWNHLLAQESMISSIGSLARALQFLHKNLGQSGAVYPPSPEALPV